MVFDLSGVIGVTSVRRSLLSRVFYSCMAMRDCTRERKRWGTLGWKRRGHGMAEGGSVEYGSVVVGGKGRSVVRGHRRALNHVVRTVVVVPELAMATLVPEDGRRCILLVSQCEISIHRVNISRRLVCGTSSCRLRRWQ
ncbi:hypothetical protein PMAYCL1PPCAC_02529 [Pristionchus mayeri]|uniref:Uncharacterized protein n=1 Tax=Pristionchus mayeri TaxID=1317129 RepID=A0AAN4Z2W8_9BILA|nr:hypothetical protein PMAYCL1PPCAC_02529 [Pristionchus mayeri]